METAVDVHNVNTAGSPPVAEGAAGVHHGQLRVGDIMSKDVVMAALDDTISSAVKRMSEHYVSCLVVMNDGRVAGILTEKDLLKGVGGRNPPFTRAGCRTRCLAP
jgi:CBS domain-containing protein